MTLSETFPEMQSAQPLGDRRILTVVIDAEEEFDWRFPLQGRGYTTKSMRQIADLQSLFSRFGIVPTYLLTYPVLEDAESLALVRHYLERGECIVGIQLHAWVTPPFSSDVNIAQSFGSNLPQDLERRKLQELIRKFEDCFGFSPRIFRSGRYGVRHGTMLLLEDLGIDIDTSLAPRSSFVAQGGPEFSTASYEIFWFGQQRNVLEVPLCRSVVGWGGLVGRGLFQRFLDSSYRSEIHSVLARMRLAERITLSPEGNDVAAMKRLVQHMVATHRKILPLSFHSSSLALGGNPYVTSQADLHAFFDRLSEIIDYLSGAGEFRPVGLSTFPELFAAPRMKE